MRIILAASLLALATAACSPGKPAASNDTAPAGAATPAGATNWGQFRDGFIEGWFRLDPAFAVYEGVHRFDGRLPDWSDTGLKRQAAFLHQAIDRARAFGDADLSPEERFERAYLIRVAEGKLFWLEDADQPHRNPAYYIGGGLDPNVYIARPYADAPTRMKALIAFLGRVPAAVQAIRTNLKTPMPRSFVDYGVAGFNGFADYYAGDAIKAFAGVADPALQQQLATNAAAAARAMRGLGSWLASQRATANTDFALGADRFQRMVRSTEGVDTSLDALEAAGRADLKRNQDALAAACKLYAPGGTIPACIDKMNADKAPDGPVAEARRQIPMLRAFVQQHDLVTIPGTEQAKVEESPPYNRQNSAYIDPAGPFEKNVPSIYYISPPDPAWDQKTRDAFVPGRNDLLFTSVHEVMPGHFLQFLHSNRAPSMLGRVFVGYAFAEGWAHYTEEMMWEAGLGNGAPGVHVGQLSNALLRDCRFLSAIGLHARGMTQEQSLRMFREQCYQDEGNARQQAARGTYDPAYLNYTLGKLMIRRLRADWTAPRGGRKAWKAFHDRFLSYGGPAIPLVRQQMLGEAEPRAVF